MSRPVGSREASGGAGVCPLWVGVVEGQTWAGGEKTDKMTKLTTDEILALARDCDAGKISYAEYLDRIYGPTGDEISALTWPDEDDPMFTMEV